MSEHSMDTPTTHPLAALRDAFLVRHSECAGVAMAAEQDNRSSDHAIWSATAGVWSSAASMIDGVLACAIKPATDQRTECDCLDRSNGEAYCLKSGQPCDATQRGGCAEADELSDTIVGSDIPDNPEFPQAAEHRPGVGVMLHEDGTIIEPSLHYAVNAWDVIAGERRRFAFVATLPMACAVAGMLLQERGHGRVTIVRAPGTPAEEVIAKLRRS